MKNELEDFLQNNRRHLDKHTPDPAVLDRILEQMQARHTGHRSNSKNVLIAFRPLLWPAACLILAACGIVFWALQKHPSNFTAVKAGISRQQTDRQGHDSITIRSAEVLKSKQAKPESLDSIEPDLPSRKEVLVARMKLHALNSAKQLMYAGLSNQESPASRINAVHHAGKLKNTGNDVVDALLGTLDSDPSANVRLAALDGLARFYRHRYVREKLMASLKKQQDPVVQIALINLLTGMREQGVMEELSKIVKDDNALTAVKDCAYAGIFRLRSS